MADISYMIGNVVDAIVTVVGTMMTVLAENAETIALVVVMGLVIGAVVKFGRSAFRSMRGMLPL